MNFQIYAVLQFIFVSSSTRNSPPHVSPGARAPPTHRPARSPDAAPLLWRRQTPRRSRGPPGKNVHTLPKSMRYFGPAEERSANTEEAQGGHSSVTGGGLLAT